MHIPLQCILHKKILVLGWGMSHKTKIMIIQNNRFCLYYCYHFSFSYKLPIGVSFCPLSLLEDTSTWVTFWVYFKKDLYCLRSRYCEQLKVSKLGCKVFSWMMLHSHVNQLRLVGNFIRRANILKISKSLKIEVYAILVMLDMYDLHINERK